MKTFIFEQMTTNDEKVLNLVKALHKHIQESGSKLHTNPVFIKLFGKIADKRKATQENLRPAVEQFVDNIKHDKVVNDRYKQLYNIHQLMPSLYDSGKNSLINLVGPIYNKLINKQRLDIKTFIRSHYDDDNNMIAKNSLTKFMLTNPVIRGYINNNDVFKNSEDLIAEGKDDDTIKRLAFIYGVVDSADYNARLQNYKDSIERTRRSDELAERLEKLKEMNEGQQKENEELKQARENAIGRLRKVDDAIKVGGTAIYGLGKKSDSIKKDTEEIKQMMKAEDVEPGGKPSPYSHLMNNTRLKRIHQFLDRGYGDMPRDEMIQKIYDDLDWDERFVGASDTERRKQAESMADAVYMRKEELGTKYRPTYERLRTLNDLNMIKSLPEHVAKELNQMDIERYNADQKKIDKIYILPKEWQRVSTAATQYNINPMLLRGAIKE